MPELPKKKKGKVLILFRLEDNVEILFFCVLCYCERSDWPCYVLRVWLLQLILVRDKNKKAHIALAGVEQLAGADIPAKCSAIIGRLRQSCIAPAECFYGQQAKAAAASAMSRFSTVTHS